MRRAKPCKCKIRARRRRARGGREEGRRGEKAGSASRAPATATPRAVWPLTSDSPPLATPQPPSGYRCPTLADPRQDCPAAWPQELDFTCAERKWKLASASCFLHAQGGETVAEGRIRFRFGKDQLETWIDRMDRIKRAPNYQLPAISSRLPLMSWLTARRWTRGFLLSCPSCLSILLCSALPHEPSDICR